MIRFFVPGIPAGKGSFKAFMPRGGRFPIVTNDSAKTRPWEQAVRAEAAIARCSKLVGAVRVRVTFLFPRPQAHFRTNGQLKPAAPHDHTKKPDTDKLARTVLDALTGVAFNDDAQVVDLVATKRYAPDNRPGADVAIESLDAAAIEEPAA